MNCRDALLGVAGLLSLLGCRSAGIDGGRIEPAAADAGDRIAEYQLEGCRDARGRPVAAPACSVSRVERGALGDVLLEERPGYETLVLEHRLARGKSWVFAVTLGDGTGKRLMHELVVPMQAGPGRFRIADAFEGEAGDAEDPLRATGVALDCALVPRVSGGALDTREGLE